jgi:DNA-binding NtrC family response regulator
MGSELNGLVSAFFKKDLAQLLELEASLPREQQRIVRALRLYIQMDLRNDGYKLYDEAHLEVTTCLNQSGIEASAFILLLGLATLFSSNAEQFDDARIFLQRLKNYLTEKLNPELRIFIHYIEARYHSATSHSAISHYSDHQKALQEGIALSKSTNIPAWFLLQTTLIEAAISHADYEASGNALAELKAYQQAHTAPGGYSLGILEASHLMHQSKNEQAIQLLENIPQEQRVRFMGHFLRLKITSLLTLNQMDEASRLLEDVKKIMVETSPATLLFRRYFTTIDYEQFKAKEAVGLKRFDQARQHLQNILSLSSTVRPAWGRMTSRWLSFNIEMASERPRAARLALQQTDPEARFRPIEWGRLHLLEKNFDKAVEYLKRAFVSHGPESLKKGLSSATEISPQTLSEILIHLWQKEPLKSKRLKQTEEDSNDSSTLSGRVTLIGNSAAIQTVRSHLEKLAPLNNTVLISGETGVGKEVIAKLLHEMSPRTKEPFIPVNCGAISETLIESELFGYEKGAFTGANTSHEGLFLSAGKGTIFLDEISSMSPHLQSALLRVLEDQQVRPVGSSKSFKIQARIIAATNEPLDKMVEQKRFRQDLFFRLAQLHIPISPLRERREDIPLLAHYFLEKLFKDLQYQISDDLLERLKQQDWPGNVRQLRNVIEQLVYHCGDSEILTADLLDQKILKAPSITAPSPSSPDQKQPVTVPLREVPLDLSYRSHRQQNILDLIRQRSKITRRELVHELRCSPNTATHDLRVLEERKLIRRIQTNPNSNSTYFVLS